MFVVGRVVPVSLMVDWVAGEVGAGDRVVTGGVHAAVVRISATVEEGPVEYGAAEGVLHPVARNTRRAGLPAWGWGRALPERPFG